MNLGLYNDNEGAVGNPIPGGQGSTTQIPDSGACCHLARVTLAGSGITLSAGTRYWLVASPDNVNGATFNGSWQTSNQGISAQGAPPPGQWSTGTGAWPAAEVRGVVVAGSVQRSETGLDRVRPMRITIFNNLDSTPTERFYPMVGNYVAGKDSEIGEEGWLALPFIPKTNCRAKTLAAAIGYVSGDMKVNLGVYSDNKGTVGSLLPGGEASTTSIPAPECCDLAEVSLSGAGVALAGETQYWLVASTDDVNAPSFEGIWRETTVFSNYQEPKSFSWTFVSSRWLAAEIREPRRKCKSHVI